MIINTEWGSFGDKEELEFIRTEWDRLLDRKTHDEGSQIFEKMTSKMYMGEIVRLLLLHLVDEKLIFDEQNHDKLKEVGSFDTNDVCQVESDPVGEYTQAKIALKNKLGMHNVLDQDCYELRRLCESVTTRAAHLTAATIVALLKKMGDNDVSIAVDGDLFRRHPHFKYNMETKIRQLMGANFQVKTFEQDIGIGAAFLAANVKPGTD